ncbi:hypothetical protein HNQ50_000808 [Silvimonas terrae]|uniref:Inorganic pyrophosphatase domain-containing protein n=1 Tax=Silvimonas terrae TaxID=300266 RepID=A0A840RC35_9NEIS|nr:hypothetical protein [Silvimonas terrae]MBB5190098.1 hypothetical protein [Silvimonas terrae]
MVDIFHGLLPDSSAQDQPQQPSNSPVSIFHGLDQGAPRSDFVRGVEDYIPQTKSLLGGALAYLGDAAQRAGIDAGGAVRDYGLQKFKEGNDEVAATGHASDSLSGALQGNDGNLVNWAKYQAGQAVGNIGETAATALAGAALGSAVPGAGTAAGTIGGVVAKGAVKAAIKDAAEVVAKRQLAGDAAEAATKQLAEQALAKKVGAAVGMAVPAVTKETGNVYGQATQDANGQPVDLARVGAAGVAAGGLQFAAEKLGLDALTHGAGATGGVAARALKTAGVTGAGAGLTGAGQVAAERYGAGKSLTDGDATQAYIDAAAAGALQGGIPGAVGGVIHGNHPAATPEVTEAAPLQIPATPESGLQMGQGGDIGDPAAEYAALQRAQKIQEDRANYEAQQQGLQPDQSEPLQIPAVPESGLQVGDGSAVGDPLEDYAALRRAQSVRDGRAQYEAQQQALQQVPSAPAPGPLETAVRMSPEAINSAVGVTEPNTKAAKARQADISAALNEPATDANGNPLYTTNPDGTERPLLAAEQMERVANNTVEPIEQAVQADSADAPLDSQAHEAATSPYNDLPEPTEAQQEAGNYQKGHIRLHGLDISIENPRDSVRSGVDPNGQPWETQMPHHYGYIKGTVGKDGDHIDTFIGPNPDSGKVFVVDQQNPQTGKFDEHKVMMGFDDLQSAADGYRASYAPDWQGMGRVTEMDSGAFKQWLKEGNTKNPVWPVARKYDGVVTKPEDIPTAPRESPPPTDQVTTPSAAPEGTTAPPPAGQIVSGAGDKTPGLTLAKEGTDFVARDSAGNEVARHPQLVPFAGQVRKYEAAQGVPQGQGIRIRPGEIREEPASQSPKETEQPQTGVTDRTEIAPEVPATSDSSLTAEEPANQAGNSAVREFQYSRKSQRPTDFVLRDGSPDWGSIPKEVEQRTKGVFPAAPIRVANGKHFGQNRGFGLAHIEESHRAQLAKLGMTAEQYVDSILSRVTDVYDIGDGRRLVAHARGLPGGSAFLELRNDGDHYSVVTAYEAKKEGKLVWSGRPRNLEQSPQYSSALSGSEKGAETPTTRLSANRSASGFEEIPESGGVSRLNPRPASRIADQTSNESVKPNSLSDKGNVRDEVGSAGKAPEKPGIERADWTEPTSAPPADHGESLPGA